AESVGGERLQPIDSRVVVTGIVVKQRESSRAGRSRHVARVLHGRMAPALLFSVLLLGVLGIVDDQIGAAQERDVSLIARMLVAARRRLPERPRSRGGGERART